MRDQPRYATTHRQTSSGIAPHKGKIDGYNPLVCAYHIRALPRTVAGILSAQAYPTKCLHSCTPGRSTKDVCCCPSATTHTNAHQHLALRCFLLREEGEGEAREEQGAEAVTAEDLFKRPVRHSSNKTDLSSTDPADLCTLTGRIQRACKGERQIHCRLYFLRTSV